jgi:hypothetical protein
MRRAMVDSEAVLVEPGKIAVQIVGVGIDGAGCGSEFI